MSMCYCVGRSHKRKKTSDLLLAKSQCGSRAIDTVAKYCIFKIVKEVKHSHLSDMHPEQSTENKRDFFSN